MSEPSAQLISAVVTFHEEGLLAHKTLLGLERVRNFTEAQGISVELVVVLDCADAETARIVKSSPVLRASDLVLDVSNKDPGASRNSGVGAARGSYIGVFDGDDYYTKNWLLKALAVVRSKKGAVVVHPECLITFGTIKWFSSVWDMDDRKEHSLSNCLALNMWIATSFGSKELYLRHPYHRNDFLKTGFGFEDWHWNLELIGHGVRHVTAKKTALFYRTKEVSTFTNHSAAGVVIRPSEFFNHPEWWDKFDETVQRSISKKELYDKSYVEKLIAGKDWLESEWKALQVELEKKQECLESTEARFQTVTDQLNRLQSALPARVLKKIRAISND
jgi:glycosyltransferase involved in cell wall biosynthesis